MFVLHYACGWTSYRHYIYCYVLCLWALLNHVVDGLLLLPMACDDPIRWRADYGSYAGVQVIIGSLDGTIRVLAGSSDKKVRVSVVS